MRHARGRRTRGSFDCLIVCTYKSAEWLESSVVGGRQQEIGNTREAGGGGLVTQRKRNKARKPCQTRTESCFASTSMLARRSKSSRANLCSLVVSSTRHTPATTKKGCQRSRRPDRCANKAATIQHASSQTPLCCRRRASVRLG